MPLELLISLVTALIGATVTAFTFRRLRLNLTLGISLGVAAGAIAPLIFMVPLQYCTFDPEVETLDYAFGLLLIGLALAAVLYPVNWLAARFLLSSPAMAKPQGAFRGWLIPVLLLLPTLIILALFLYYPIVDTFRLSTLLVRLGSPRTAFICVDNFTRLAEDATYLRSLGTTFVLSGAIIVLSMALALFIALMAYQPIKGANIYRTLLIWPYAVSPAVAGIIFLLMFNPAGGIINYFLDNLFGVRPGWLNDPAVAPWTIIIASVWKSLGFNILFYIAGLQNVPKELDEAAAIDGANAWQRFWRVTFPLLSPITFFLVITNLTYAFFDTFGTIDYLTPGGGPLNSTNTLMYNIYQVGIQNNDLGKAAAQSLVLFLIVIAITYLQFRTGGQRVNYGA